MRRESAGGHQAPGRRWLVFGANKRKSSSIQTRNEAWNRDGVWKIWNWCAARNAEQYSETGWLEIGANMKYAVVVEQGETSFGAHVPDLPGCVAVAETRNEVLKLIQEAIQFHIEGLREDGLPVPSPSSSVEFVEVRAA